MEPTSIALLLSLLCAGPLLVILIAAVVIRISLWN